MQVGELLRHPEPCARADAAREQDGDAGPGTLHALKSAVPRDPPHLTDRFARGRVRRTVVLQGVLTAHVWYPHRLPSGSGRRDWNERLEDT
ncbi:hypothetical protein GCM10011584_23670 [Nocardioides phosphati]|uniref:Uncharacterized protein n=1 Tax=Nocardioides phosphati TaxID=1867775 RepID=A0ABQ2NC61_9ACTN|nr:hypothetical protein GCM10011584_23670 [Nocardioides phosphati]